MELSKRLKAVADLVSAGSIVCDAGCDHGYVPIYLVQSGICKRAIAADVKEGPLSCARENISAFGLEEYIETRLSDGVSAIETGEADTLILAGMGGRLVIRILTKGRTVIRSMRELILQPQSDIALVRAFLREEGYRIVLEDMVYEDGKYYPMMKVTVLSQSSGEVAPANKEAPGGKAQEKGCTKMAGTGMETAQRREDIALRQQAFDRYGEYLLAHRHPVLRQFLLWEQEREHAILRNLTAAQLSRESAAGKADALQHKENEAVKPDVLQHKENEAVKPDVLQHKENEAVKPDALQNGENEAVKPDLPDRNLRRVQELLAAEQIRAYALSYYTRK